MRGSSSPRATRHGGPRGDDALRRLPSRGVRRARPGDAAGAEDILSAGYERLAKMGEKALLAETAAMLADVVYEQGRLDEALAFTRAAKEASAANDISAQIMWRAVRARILDAEGRNGRSETDQRRGGRYGRAHGLAHRPREALLSQGQVLLIAGEAERREAMRGAIALYARKGNTIGLDAPVQRLKSGNGLRVKPEGGQHAL